MTEQLFGTYRLGDSLGSGSTGDVFAATNPNGDPCALKILRRELVRSAEIRLAVIAEVRAQTSIRDRHLVQIRGHLEVAGELAIVMDLVQGGSLRDRLRRGGPVEPAQACGLAAEVARGLAALHAAGLAHGDIKPDNILIDTLSEPALFKVADAGLSDLLLAGPGQQGVVGTLEYLAPERLDGPKSSPAADLYALGILLYEICTGVVPFPAENFYAALRHHQGSPPERPPGMPTPVWAVFLTLADRVPARRPIDARAAAIGLSSAAAAIGEPDTLAERSAISGPPRMDSPTVVTPSRRRARVAIAGIVAAAVIAGAAISLTVRSVRDDETADVAIAATAPVSGGLTRLSVDSIGGQLRDSSYDAVISGDGTHVAFISESAQIVAGDSNGVADLFIRDLGSGRAQKLRVGARETADTTTLVALSASGRRVAFESFDAIDADDRNGLVDVYLADLDTGLIELVSRNSIDESANGSSRTPAISGDGRRVAFSSNAGDLGVQSGGGVGVYVRDFTAGTVTSACADETGQPLMWNCGLGAVALSADGNHVAFDVDTSPEDARGAREVYVKDLVTGTLTRTSESLSGSEPDGPTGQDGIAISADGRFTVFTSEATNLVPDDTNAVGDILRFDLDTGELTRINVDADGRQSTGHAIEPSVSSDGLRIAFESGPTGLDPPTPAADGVFLQNAADGSITWLEQPAAGEVAGVPGPAEHLARPRVSADGSLVIFSSAATNLVPGDTNGTTDVFLWRASDVDDAADVGDSFAQALGPAFDRQILARRPRHSVGRRYRC
ncbi:MAG: protein kinase domain-containing protein [Sporichthyaceae bacterium]